MESKPTSLWTQTILPSLSLFTSIGTLICCALPALLVTLGMGATLAGLVSTMPWMVTISEQKGLVFSISGLLILLGTYIQWRMRYAPCPADPKKAKACQKLRKLSWIILATAIILYVIGFFFAFVAVYVFY